ncbi:AAA family ATPase [Marinagarivorans cellulosilyticus]|uniref:DNA repair protein SbcC/Rad50 n=1 Tax=Marinagarivorans cellulosilyticus TaxID=2721545 RepID=A0AAN1WL45_9GAMM|nr:SMC family ATPase [Marinagarivorans cellulosilyticus]BCD99613.1 DNA repair protein SbcC/Rad50 [Marinagarivorans cellulosilyticus]
MKPLQLSLQAFGPFAQQQTLDFSQLGDYPLFLINGATGAGKSTLLDAMCFALYGQTNGKERDATQMRCDHADQNTITEVDFIFSIGTEIYRVYRMPMQERAKARGEGTTTQQTEASLWHIGATHKPIDNTSDIEGTLIISKSAQQVNQKVIELLGLNVEQFRQVMILPQGKFREFLLADSKQREDIFTTLFQTEIYTQLQDQLTKNARHTEAQYEKLKLEHKLVLENVEAEDSDALTIRLTQQKEITQTALDTLEKNKALRDASNNALQQAGTLNTQLTTLKKYQTEYAELLSQQPEIETLEQQLKRSLSASKISHIKETLNALIQQQQQAEQNIANLNSSITNQYTDVASATAELKNAQQAVTKSEPISAEIFRLQQLQPNVANLHSATEQYHLLLQKYNNANDRLKNETLNISSHKESLDETEKTLKEWEKVSYQLPALIAHSEKQKVRIQQRSQCLALSKKIESNQVVITQHEGKLSELKAQGLQLKEQLNQIEYRWHTQQAAVLAATLNKNHPCPVCGSLEHPIPAQHESKDLINTDTINTQREQLEKLRANYAQQQNTLAQLNAQQQQTLKEKSALDDLIGIPEHPLEEEQEQYAAQLYDIQGMNHQINDIPKLQQQINLLQQKIADAETSFNTAQAQCHSLNTELVRATEKKEQLEQAIPEDLRDTATLQQRINQHQKILEDTKAHEASCKKALELAQLQLNTLTTTLQEQEKGFQSLRQRVTQETHSWHAALEQNSFTDEEVFKQAQRSEVQQKQLTERIDTYNQKTHQLATLLKNQESLLEGKSTPDIEKLTEDFKVSEQRYKVQQHQWQQHQSNLENLVRADKKLQAIAKQRKKTDKEFELLGTLAHVANGKNPQKISLQRFVLGVLLDDVLIEASHRLIKMSKGRYRLLRNNDRAKGNRASGLELLIEDNYTGITRSAATLSGGESFLAALALALGLSDVVQAYAGGIKLDALFIDEGFGSLDQEALDLAIDTLMELQSSGKMIGIISHVTELKAQMALQVEIISSPSGSALNIKY